MDGIDRLQYGAVMPDKPCTLADLRKAGTIDSLEIVAAVDAYIRDPAAGPYHFASGRSLDIAAAVASSSEFTEMAARSETKEKIFRTAVATIVMTMQPTLTRP